MMSWEEAEREVDATIISEEAFARRELAKHLKLQEEYKKSKNWYASDYQYEQFISKYECYFENLDNPNGPYSCPDYYEYRTNKIRRLLSERNYPSKK